MTDYFETEPECPDPVSVDLDGDPAWVYVCARPEEAATHGLMVVIDLMMTVGTCEYGEAHAVLATQNLAAPEARKLAASLLNAADELESIVEEAEAA